MIVKIQIWREISIERTSQNCLHPENPTDATPRFRIISQSNDVVQVEACGRYFYISADALAAYWTGQWILLWWSVSLWARTLGNRTRLGQWRISAPFHLRRREEGLWMLAGGSCGHQPEIYEKELKFSLIGRLLLMEHTLRFKNRAQRRPGFIVNVYGP